MRARAVSIKCGQTTAATLSSRTQTVESAPFLTDEPHWSMPGGTTAFESLRTRMNWPASALSGSPKNVIDLPVRPARPVRPMRWMYCARGVLG